MSIKLSVIIPAYNEQERLPGILKSIDSYLTKQDYGYEIMVVNDGSSDNTAQVTKELKTEIDNLRLINNEENHGKGYAVKEGLMKSEGQYRLFTDADNSTSIDQVEKMWPYLDEYDVVIGSRDLEDSVLDPPQPWFREHVLGAGFKLVRKLILNLWGFEDTQCGFKIFTAPAAEEITSKCKVDGFAFDPEMLILAKRLGFKIKEIPVHWVNKAGSKVDLEGMVKMGWDLLKIRWDIIMGKYDDRS